MLGAYRVYLPADHARSLLTHRPCSEVTYPQTMLGGYRVYLAADHARSLLTHRPCSEVTYPQTMLGGDLHHGFYYLVQNGIAHVFGRLCVGRHLSGGVHKQQTISHNITCTNQSATGRQGLLAATAS